MAAMRWNWKGLAAAAAMAFGAHACTATAAVPLPSLGANPAEVSVSGLSAGGFMAVQLHVAYSATFKRGAGVVAGGPYYCAEGSVLNATGRCMAHGSSIPVSSLVSTTNSWAASGAIDPVSNMAGSKVYLFSGTSDNTVKQAVMDDLKTYYQSFVSAANTAYKNNIGAGHAMVTDDYGGACSTTASPYINNCGFDLAKARSSPHLYGTLNPRNNGTLGGNFTEFDQSAFITGHGVAATGWIYVPQACCTALVQAARGTARLPAELRDVSATSTCATPATTAGPTPTHHRADLPADQHGQRATNSCWDWWGYDNANYAKKSGPQMAALKAMVDRVTGAGGGSSLPAPTGVGTSGATGSSMVIGWGGVSVRAATTSTGPAARSTPRRWPAPATPTPAWPRPPPTAGPWPRWTPAMRKARCRPRPRGTTLAGSGGGGTCYTASNYAHTVAGRAYALWGLCAMPTARTQNMGLWNIYVTTTLKQTGPTTT
jgi:predicted esterase